MKQKMLRVLFYLFEVGFNIFHQILIIYFLYNSIVVYTFLSISSQILSGIR